jgi:hypothetical protein
MFFRKKDKYAPARETLEMLDGKRISYIVERENGQESVVGRTGGITLTDDEIIILCDGSEVFRGELKGARIAELMSKNGVDIKAFDSVKEKERHVTAYFANWKQ